VLVLGALLAAACGDDGVALTDSASGAGSSTGTTDAPTTINPTMTVPTTTDTPPPTTTDTPPPTTTDPTDTDTTVGVTDTTVGTDTDTTVGTDTDTTVGPDTDTTTGGELPGKSVTQTVNGGTVASSTNFRMVFTLGQPTQHQGVYSSANFRLQGGLIGANGNPP